MTFKKIIIIFLLILAIFSFSSVRAENINVTSSSAERMKCDIDFFKQVLKNNNINNMEDLKSFVGANSVVDIEYFFIKEPTIANYQRQYVRFYKNFYDISFGVNDYSYYGIQQNSFAAPYQYSIRYSIYGSNSLDKIDVGSGETFSAPVCWFGVKTADLFTKDSSQIVASAVENANNSINNLNDKITEDHSNQNEINLGSHNDEMNNASDTIKNSGLFFRFHNYLVDQINEAFTYNDDDVSTIPISIYGKSYVLRSDEISSFFKNNGLGFVVTLWQSILWFSLFYTMFLFVRKLYKAFVGGNPVDEVSSTLSSEDNKIVGGF